MSPQGLQAVLPSGGALSELSKRRGSESYSDARGGGAACNDETETAMHECTNGLRTQRETREVSEEYTG